MLDVGCWVWRPSEARELRQTIEVLMKNILILSLLFSSSAFAVWPIFDWGSSNRVADTVYARTWADGTNRITASEMRAIKDTAAFTNGAELVTNVLNSITNTLNVYGFIGIHDGTNIINIATTTNYYQITGFTSVVYTNITCTSSGFTNIPLGKYVADGSVSILGSNSKTYELAFFVNDVHQDYGEGRMTTPSVGATNVAVTAIPVNSLLNITTTNNWVDIRIEGTGTGNITVQQSFIRLWKISK
jgi:hypothetical protein